MGHSRDYPDVPDWKEKPEGYKTGERVKYQGNIFEAAFWASKPGEGKANENGWRLYDELYDVTTTKKTERVNIIGYIPTWRKQEGFDYRNSELYQYITHGIIAFLMFDEGNLGEFEPKALDDVNLVISDIVSVGHAVGTKICIALGGATDYGFLYLMERIGNNPSDPLLNQTVQKVVDFVESNDLDGVDLDLECWWAKSTGGQDLGGREAHDGSNPHPAGIGLTAFARELKQAMPDKIISAALFATSWYGNNYDPKLADYLDWVAVMTYDLTGSWNNSPVGPHTALYKIRDLEPYAEEQQGTWPPPRWNKHSEEPMKDNPILSVEDSLWYWTNPFYTNWQGEGQKLPRNKLAAGVPIYAYDFAYDKDPDDLSGEKAPGYKQIRYKDLLSQFPNAHNAADANIKVSGSTPRPNFLPPVSGNYPYKHNIYFETPKTALEKLKFIKSVGGQGIIIWELSNEVWQDGKSIVKTLYQNSGNPKKSPIETENSEHNSLTSLIIKQLKTIDVAIKDIVRKNNLESSPISKLPFPQKEDIRDYGNSVGLPKSETDAIEKALAETKGEFEVYSRGNPNASGQLEILEKKVEQTSNSIKTKIIEDDEGWKFVPVYQIWTHIEIAIQSEATIIDLPSGSSGGSPGDSPGGSPGGSPGDSPGGSPGGSPGDSPGGSPGDSDSSNSAEEKQKNCKQKWQKVKSTIDDGITVIENSEEKSPGKNSDLNERILNGDKAKPPAQKQYQYHVKLKVEISVPSSSLQSAQSHHLFVEIQFFNMKQTTELAKFIHDVERGIPPLFEGSFSGEGTAYFNYDISFLVSQGWEAEYIFGSDGRVDFTGMSGERIGYLTSNIDIPRSSVNSMIGNGNFRNP